MPAYRTAITQDRKRFHFGHFFAGYFFPVMCQRSPRMTGRGRHDIAHSEDQNVYVEDCGPMNAMWSEITDRKIVIGIPKNKQVIWLENYDKPAVTNLTLEDINVFRKNIWKNWVCPHVPQDRRRRVFTLIGRATLAPEFYAKFGDQTGKHRRTFANEAQLFEELRKFRPFQLVYLEQHTAMEQAKIFHNSDIVIAQHGAGIMNAIYMRTNSALIEVGPRKWLFHNWCLLAGTKRYHYRTKSHHAPVDAKPLIQMIKNILFLMDNH